MRATSHSSCESTIRLRRCRQLTQDTAMPLVTFELDRDFVELNQLLKLTGLCDSGGAGKPNVASGAVRVDGVVELRKTFKIHAGQRVTSDDVEIDVVSPT